LKIGLASLLSLTIILLCWFLFSEYKSVNFAALPEVKTNEFPKILPQKIDDTATQNNLASASDIQNALLSADNSQQLLPATAERADILQALMFTQSTVDETKTSESIEQPVLPLLQTKVTPIGNKLPSTEIQKSQINNIENLPLALDEQYYLNSEKGYAIQITGFSDLSRLEAFIKNHNAVDYFSYQKSLNTKKFFVLTSKIYSDKTQAREALNKLPQPIKALGSFLKSVSTIKREINTVSQ